MTSGHHATDRAVLRVSGDDSHSFLQGLITNDIARLDDRGAVYAALLSPQGKYLFDFFLMASKNGVLIDVQADRAADLLRRLNMYRLRAKVAIEAVPMQVVLGHGDTPDGAYADPRHPDLGWRACVEDADAWLGDIPDISADVLEEQRVSLCIPKTGAELVADDCYILEMGFERLNGVDFRKGCYVGQEVTARMKHKTELKKGLAPVAVTGSPPPSGSEITCDGKTAGKLYSTVAGVGLAYLRFDRVKGDMQSGDATITRLPEPS